MGHCILFLKQKILNHKEKEYAEDRAQVWRYRAAELTRA